MSLTNFANESAAVQAHVNARRFPLDRARITNAAVVNYNPEQEVGLRAWYARMHGQSLIRNTGLRDALVVQRPESPTVARELMARAERP